MISLQFITHRTERYSYFESARMALEGGCKWIQLRMKDAPLDEVEAVALQLKPLCKEHEAILILDDHVSPHPSDQNQLSYMVKHAMGGGDFLLRTRRKVRSEVALLFLGYNLKRAVKVLGFQEIMDRLEAISHILFRILTYFCGLHNHHVLRGTRERERTKRTKKDFRA